MKDTFYFTTRLTPNEHDIVEDIFRKELLKKGYDLLYYREFKGGHIPLMREAKSNSPRYAILDICMDFNINIISNGFRYENGVMSGEAYEQGYEN